MASYFSAMSFFSLNRNRNRGPGCLEVYGGRLGDSEPLKQHELLWVLGCETLKELKALKDDV